MGISYGLLPSATSRFSSLLRVNLYSHKYTHTHTHATPACIAHVYVSISADTSQYG